MLQIWPGQRSRPPCLHTAPPPQHVPQGHGFTLRQGRDATGQWRWSDLWGQRWNSQVTQLRDTTLRWQCAKYYRREVRPVVKCFIVCGFFVVKLSNTCTTVLQEFWGKLMELKNEITFFYQSVLHLPESTNKESGKNREKWTCIPCWTKYMD